MNTNVNANERICRVADLVVGDIVLELEKRDVMGEVTVIERRSDELMFLLFEDDATVVHVSSLVKIAR